MSITNKNDFGLTGIGSSVRYGKGNGIISFTGGTGFGINDVTGTNLATLSIGSATIGSHAVRLDQLYALVGSTALTGTNGVSFDIATGIISTVLATNSGLSNAGSLKLNIAGLSAGTALGTTDLVAISQSGSSVTTTIGSLATIIAGASVFGTGAIHATSGTVSLVTDGEFAQTGGTLSLGNITPTSITTSGTVATGALTATSGSFSSALNVTGTLSSGTISAPAGSFSGTITAGTVSATTGSFSGALTGSSIIGSNGTISGLFTAGTIAGTTGTFSGNVNVTGTLSASNITGTNTGDQTITLSGDVTSGAMTNGTFATTLATVNSNVGTFGDASSIPSITVNAKGLITAIGTIPLTYSAPLKIVGSTISINYDGSSIVNTGGTLVVGTISANQITSGTLNGIPVTGLPSPVNATDAATKAYVDGALAGLDVKQAVQAATTGTLNATYSTDVLTEVGNGALIIDGYTALVGDRILVKNQIAPNDTQNGIYVVTATGNAGAHYVLTRTADMNASDQIPAAFTFVINGSVNAGIGYVVTGFPTTGTIDVNPIHWTQFSQAGAYSVASQGGLSIDTTSVPALFKVNFTNMTSANPLGTSNLVAISQDGTNVVYTTIGSLATEIAGASVFGTDAIHVTNGTVSLVTDGEFAQTGGTLSLGNITPTSITTSGTVATGALTATSGSFSSNLNVSGSVAGSSFIGTIGSFATSVTTGSVSATTGSFSGALTGSSIIGSNGTIGGLFTAGTLSATIGTISSTLNAGTVIGTIGSFSGALTGGTIIGGDIQGSNGTFSGAVNVTGTITASNYNGTQGINVTGDVTGTGTNNITLTLGSVNSNIGTFTAVTVGSKGLVTAASNLVATGDVTGTASGASIALTLGSVNVNPGTFAVTVAGTNGLVTNAANLVVSGDMSGTSAGTALAITLGTSGVTAGTYGNTYSPSIITVDAKGRVTSASTGTITLGTGSVTSIKAGTGLNGGTITNAGTINLDLTTLGSAGTVGSSSIVAVSNGGTTYTTTVGSLVSSVVNVPATAIQGTAGVGVASVTIGTIPTVLSPTGTYMSVVGRVVVNVDTAYTSGTMTITDGTNTYMIASENDITVPGIYIAELPMTVDSAGQVISVAFGSAPSGTGHLTATIKFDLI